jgi:hypothetical protein
MTILLVEHMYGGLGDIKCNKYWIDMKILHFDMLFL